MNKNVSTATRMRNYFYEICLLRTRFNYIIWLTIAFFQINTVKPEEKYLKSELHQKIISPTPWLTSRTDLLKILPKQGTVAEIGVQKGDFSEEILLYAQPTHLYLIDCWQEQNQENYPNDPANVTQNQQEALYQFVCQKFAFDKRVIIIRDFSPDVTRLFKDNSLDWVFIDANHTYEAVKKDLEAWFSKVKVGGFICGHDYTYTNLFPLGVVPAVNEFVKKNNLKIDYLTNELHGWVSYAIRKK